MSDEPRKIAVVTGTRAEYGLLKKSMNLIKKDRELDLELFVTGMHLSPRHGETYKEIIEDDFEIDYKIDMNMDSGSQITMGKSMGIGIMGFSEGFRHRNPDMVLVLGDRSEAFAAAVAASHMNIPVGHIAGGQISGGVVIDSQVRHAITKLSHLHFTSTHQNSKRVRQLGEEDWRIHPVGATGVDDIDDNNYIPPEEFYRKYNIPKDQSIAVIIYHPETTNHERAGEQMEKILRATKENTCYPVIIYPNSDLGSQHIIAQINKAGGMWDNYSVYENIERHDFLGLLNIADVMVGNSSSGLIEAPSFDLPVVNVGDRQSGRQRAKNVIQVSHDKKKIKEAIRMCLRREGIKKKAENCENPYFLGGAAEQIKEIIKSISIDESLLRKETVLEL